MKTVNKNLYFQNFTAGLLSLLAIFLFGTVSTILAHGGEDHGDEKPKTETTGKGTVSRSSRLGAYEIMLKHPALEPDTASVGRFFVTKFETNEAAADVSPAVEIEAANGTVTPIETEKTDQSGSYIVKIPALPEGVYTIRAKLTYAGGTDTATFSGVQVAHSEAANGGAATTTAWLGSILFFLIGAIILGAFGALFYLAWRTAGRKSLSGKETVSI